MRSVRVMTKLLLKEIFRRKDFYVAFILGGIIVVYASSLKFYNVSKISGYLLETGLMLVFWFSAILTVSLAARQYPAERESKTLEVLLAKPISRLEFLVSKWAGSFAAGAMTFLIFFSVFLAVASARMDGFSWSVVLETGFLFLLTLFVLSAMASALSYYLTVSATVTLTLLLFLIMDAYGASLKSAGEHLAFPARAACAVFYYGLPHFEFFDMRQRLVHEWGPVPLWLVGALAVYAALYAVVFLAAAWMSFRRRTL
jgi:ABC-type transport system involved in multi-copper enzyme maturation permease subunit